MRIVLAAWAAAITTLGFTGAGTSSEAADRPSKTEPATAVRSEAEARACKTARKGLRWYVRWTNHWRNEVGAGANQPQAVGSTCPRYLANIWRKKARSARGEYVAWLILMQNPTEAIMHVFGPVYGPQALRVASCESGRGIWAQNGQYLGMFQMGSSERRTYGHSNTALGQARCAYAYFVASGRDWSPWACKPW